MTRIKDESGSIISGIFRTDTGSIVVDDPRAYSKYMKDKERAIEFTHLTKKVETLETIVNRMMAVLEDTNK